MTGRGRETQCRTCTAELLAGRDCNLARTINHAGERLAMAAASGPSRRLYDCVLLPHPKPDIVTGISGVRHEATHFSRLGRGWRRTASFRDRPAVRPCPTVRAAVQPDAAGPDHHHGRGDSQSRLYGVRHAVRHEHGAGGQAADGGGLHGLRRRPGLSDQAARRAEMARRRTCPGAGLRCQPGALGGAGHLRPDGGEGRRQLGVGRRPDDQNHPEAAVSAADRGACQAGRADSVHDAGAACADRSVQGRDGDGRVGPVPLPEG